MPGTVKKAAVVRAGKLQRFIRATLAQRFLLRSKLLMVITVVIMLWPLVQAAVHVRAGGLGNLLNLMLIYAQLVLPLWVLVAAGLIWRDAEALQRPLLLSSSPDITFIVASKFTALLLPFLGLALLVEWGFPHLYTWAGGTLTGGSVAWPLAPGVLGLRALAAALLFAALGSAGGSLGFTWAGVMAGTVIWLFLAIAGVQGLNLTLGGHGAWMPWSEAGQYSLAAALGAFLPAALSTVVIMAITIVVASAGQRGARLIDAAYLLARPGRLLRRQLPLLRHPGLIWMVLALLTLPLFLIIWHQAGRIGDNLLIQGLAAFHEQWLPLVALVAAGTLWLDKEGPHTAVFASWPVQPALLAVTRSVVALAGFALLAGALAIGSTVLLSRLTGAAPPPAGWLFSRSLASGAVLLGLATVGAAAGGSWVGMLLGAALWVLGAAAPGVFATALGGGLDLFAWSHSGYRAFPGAATQRALVVALLLQLVALTILSVGRWRR